MYFRLNPECYYIKGESGGAIYDLIDEKIHRLDSQESILIEKCENNLEIDEKNDFLKQLKYECLGNFYNKKVFIQKIRVGSPIQDSQTNRPPLISRAFLEINNKCNHSCWFCGYYGIHRSVGCMGCNKWNESGNHITIKKWKQIIDDLKDLNCDTLIFTGGDLSLVWEQTKELLEYAGNAFRKKFVILNKKNLSENTLKEIEKIADPIIQTDNENEIDTDFLYLLTIDQNQAKNFREQNDKKIVVDFLFKNFNHIDPNNPVLSHQKIRNANIHSFFHNGKKHPCLGNSITISWNGYILPCPLFRKHRFAKINGRSISDFFQKDGKKLEQFWMMHLGKIQKCGNCEFRYACEDCRALEESITGDLYGKTLCQYNLKSGTWI